jgi:UDP-N-acetylglucosamine 2-epimerase (non-hydrolysing)
MHKKKKILIVFGTRPEAIKMAPLVHAIKKYPDEFNLLICVTAQHRHMLDQVLQSFEIHPDIDLDLMSSGQDLFDITGLVLSGMKKVLLQESPDLIVVHGDTTTALATSIAGFYKNIPIAHIEAGLRTYDLGAPFPEEFNRQLISKVASLHFAPTSLSRENLLSENIPDKKITVTGNTVIDALFLTLDLIESSPTKKKTIENLLSRCLPADWNLKRFVLITGHRRENFGDGFLQICDGIRDLAVLFPDVYFVYPVHLNPSVQEPVKKILSNLPNIFLIEPLDYEPFVYLMKNCYLVLTDSGGIQEEAPSLGKPVLVMRDKTERPEAVSAGTVKLVGASRGLIVKSVAELLKEQSLYEEMSLAHNPYGDGRASDRIIHVLRNL